MSLAAIAILDHWADLAFACLADFAGFLAAKAKHFQDDFSFELNLLTDKANDFLQLSFDNNRVVLAMKSTELSEYQLGLNFQL